MAYKPAGFTSVAPYLIVADAAATLDFIERVFGAAPGFVHRDDAGEIVHAEVRIDDTVVMCGQAATAQPAHVHVYVPDADAAVQRAIDAGATMVQAVGEKGDGDRRGGVADPSGTTWWLATMTKPRD